jgi:hypothetical protein
MFGLHWMKKTGAVLLLQFSRFGLFKIDLLGYFDRLLEMRAER